MMCFGIPLKPGDNTCRASSIKQSPTRTEVLTECCMLFLVTLKVHPVSFFRPYVVSMVMSVSMSWGCSGALVSLPLTVQPKCDVRFDFLKCLWISKIK